MRVFVLSVFVILLTSLAATAIDLQDTLAPFESLVGTSWIGHFISTPAPPFEHEIEWNSTLRGHVIQWSKLVYALDFTMETFFFWDAEADTIVFTQLSSNGVHSRGTVESQDGKIELVGTIMHPWGVEEFRQTFEIMPDGTLTDRYYRQGVSGWIPTHVIVYDRRP